MGLGGKDTREKDVMTGQVGRAFRRVCSDAWVPVVGSWVDGETADSPPLKGPHMISAQILSLGNGGSRSVLQSGEEVL